MRAPDQQGGHVNGKDMTAATRNVKPSAPNGAVFEPGDVIPGAGLQVLRVLGEGGFGIVFECMDLELGIPVAVKLLRTNAGTSPEVVAVFKEESRALAKLDSEHIVRVRRFGVTQESIPRPFLVMFKLEGHTLLDALATLGRFSEADTVLYGIHIGLGLATAHAAGLVHRDIKPANIFLSKRKDPITGAWVTMATILDFGIARAASSGAPDSARLPVICSHPYCCPTQYQGRAFPQSDLYALAVTMFLMLTRDHPLGNIVSDREWVRAKLVDRPKPQLVNEVIRELNLLRGPKKQKIALVDPELEDLLDRCLAYDPEDRPGTAEAFVRSLEIIHERIKARREAEEDATLTQQGFTPAPRGAKTVPEPYEWMRKRVSAEIARSRQALPAGEPEVVETVEDATERLERSRAIEQAVAGLPLDSPPLTDAEVEAIRAGHGARAPQTVPKDVRQQLVLAGSTLESPQAAQRSMRKHSTSSGRVTFALGADKTPVMAPGLLPHVQPHDARSAANDPRQTAAQHSQRRGFTAANSSLVELPVSRLWLWKERAAALLRDVGRPKRGKHWRSVALFVSAGFALATALVVLGVSLWHSVGASATAEPKASGPVASPPALPAASPSAAFAAAVSVQSALPAPSTNPVPVATVAPAATVASGSATSLAPAAHGGPASRAGVAPDSPKSGPTPSQPSTSAPAGPVPPSSPPPMASCKFCYLIDGTPTPPPPPPATSAKPKAAPAGSSKPANPDSMSPTIY